MNDFKSFSSTVKSGYLYGVDAIREDILALIYTKKGEFPMMPNKGCIIHDYLFENEPTPEEIDDIQADMLEQLQSDIRLENIQVVVAVADQGSKLVCAIQADIKVINEQILMSETFNIEG